MKKVAVIHSGMGTVEQIKKLFAELLPEVKLINIVDDSLAGSVLQAGYASPAERGCKGGTGKKACRR